MGYTPAYFSFNTDGGRCEECKGEGTVTIEMQFMADLVLTCESCHGQRFKPEILDVLFHEKNVYDVLNMTINQAIEFFSEHKQKRIVALLKPLQDVGLGYIKLGQSSSTLSGGENQRLSIARAFLRTPRLFIFDESTANLDATTAQKVLRNIESHAEKIGAGVVYISHDRDVFARCNSTVMLKNPIERQSVA